MTPSIDDFLRMNQIWIRIFRAVENQESRQNASYICTESISAGSNSSCNYKREFREVLAEKSTDERLKKYAVCQR